MKYYLSDKGNDSVDGVSKQTAWKTIAKVNSYCFATGDTLCIEQGYRGLGNLIADCWGMRIEFIKF